MIYNLSNDYDLPKFKAYVNKLYEKRAVVEVKEKHPNRSLAQNRYLHLIISYFAAEYGCSADEAKVRFYKQECNKVIFERTKVNKQGKEITYLRSSRDLDTGEMSLSIDRFRNWSSSQAGIYLPSPNEESFLLYIQKVIEQNKEYI